MESRRLYRSRTDRVVSGLAGGLAAHLGLDPVLVRIGFVALALAGVGIIAYIIGWIAIPEAPEGYQPTAPADGGNNARFVAGVVVIAVGVLLLLDQFLPLRRVLWPLAVISVGALMIVYGARR